jgi:predicted HAD superfamily Cof-like phosphohydrolase
MKNLQQQVFEFHTATGMPIANKPGVPSDDRVRLRAKLIAEECVETLGAAVCSPAWKSVIDIINTLIETCPIQVDLVELADGFADIDYVVEGARLEFGINGVPIAAEVHRSNMAKVVNCPDCVHGLRQKNDHDAEKCPTCGGRGTGIMKRADGKGM